MSPKDQDTFYSMFILDVGDVIVYDIVCCLLVVPAIYMAFDQVMLTAGIILSIIVYNCHHRNVKRDSVPDCLRTVSRFEYAQYASTGAGALVHNGHLRNTNSLELPSLD